MAKTTILILSLCMFIARVKPARILAVLPMPSISHQVVFRPLTQELARRGHDVVVLTTDPAFAEGKSPVNLTEIDMHGVSYAGWRKILQEEVTEAKPDMYSQMSGFYKAAPLFIEPQMNIAAVKEIIDKKRGEFDLLITEACIRPALGFSHVYKVPLIQISSFGFPVYNEDYVGASNHPILYPNVWQRRIYNLSKWEKLVGLWEYWKLKNYFFGIEKDEDAMMQRVFGADVPPLSELSNNVQMIILNTHPIWDDNRPVPPSVVYVGGLHLKPPQELPQDLKSYLDSSKNGVVYVSFGTNVLPSSMPPKTLQTLLKVLSELPHNVLLKWADELPIKTENIRLSKWFPQADILRHPKVKLFITQGGLQSTDEAITGGVPLIGIPILGDQWYNTEKYVRLGIGKKLNFESLTEEDLRDAIDAVITDKSYRENIVKLRALMQDQPQTPLERAVWWIEHVLRHGAGHLRSPAANMPLRQFLELDLALIVLAVILFALALFGLALNNIYRLICKTKNLKAKTS